MIAQARQLLEVFTSVYFKEALPSDSLDILWGNQSFSLVKEFIFKKIKNRLKM